VEPAKAAANLRKHRVSFGASREVTMRGLTISVAALIGAACASPVTVGLFLLSIGAAISGSTTSTVVLTLAGWAVLALGAGCGASWWGRSLPDPPPEVSVGVGAAAGTFVMSVVTAAAREGADRAIGMASWEFISDLLGAGSDGAAAIGLARIALGTLSGAFLASCIRRPTRPVHNRRGSGGVG
jgi:hypothetical protein